MARKYTVFFALLLLLLAASYFLYKRDNANISPTQEEIIQAEQNMSENSANLWGLFAFTGGPSRTCIFENTTSTGTSKGVIYTNETGARGDFTVVMGDKTVESHMIVLEDTSYIWQDGQSQGIKSAFGEESLSLFQGENPESLSETNESNDTGKFECNDWKVDQSFFVLPENIQFVSAQELLK